MYLCLLMTALNLTLSYAQQQTDYKMVGPYEVVARDGEVINSRGGVSVIMTLPPRSL